MACVRDNLFKLTNGAENQFAILIIDEPRSRDEKAYPSDISRETFEEIRPILESVRKKTRLRTVDLHEVFNVVRYLLKTGTHWRMLPGGFPKWVTVYSYFAKWSNSRQGRYLSSSVISPWTQQGLPHAAEIKTTDVTDRAGMIDTLRRGR